VHLRFGRQSNGQLFRVQPAPVQAFYNYFWIRSHNGEEAVAMAGILRMAPFDSNSEAQLFRIEQMSNASIEQSAIIINNMSGKAIDVPQATMKVGERIIQWEHNRRWNQRWRLLREGNGILIQSFFNELVLDISEQKRESGAKVIQWPANGQPNQLWLPEAVGNGVYKLHSAMEPSLCLSVRKVDVNDGGQLEISDQENPSMYWRFEGAQP
jgi:hypothetical protein